MQNYTKNEMSSVIVPLKFALQSDIKYIDVDNFLISDFN